MSNELSYENHEGIHQIIWHKSSREAVDLFVKTMSDIIETDGVINYLLVDFVESGVPPSRYMVQTVTEWQRRYKRQEETFLAIVYRPDRTELVILQALVYTTTRKRESTIRFFPEEEREQAFKWLQEEKAKVTCSK